MLVLTVAGILAALSGVVLYFKLKSMRLVDRVKLQMAIHAKLRIPQLFQLTGLDTRMKPKLTQFTASNGFKILLPSPFTVAVNEILKFKVREDDVFIVAYPKAGTTWMQEIVWLICNDGNIKEANKQLLTLRSPFLGIVDCHLRNGFQSLENWSRNKQRVIKTHLPYELLPEDIRKGKRCKIIYVARNPKDLCVSYYHFHRCSKMLKDPGTWPEFFANFCSHRVGFGDWFDHTLKFWEKYQEDKERIYFVTYENLKKDLRKEVESMSKFLEKKLSEQQLDAISEHCTFDSMSKNRSTNMSMLGQNSISTKKSKFMRKGQVGDWRNYFTINQSLAFDELYQEKIKGTGFDISFGN
uniref:sulfotransferase 1E1-like isoform X1 n=1 Tax=Styela clava TaxID=7725 RepID=UPI001939BBD6|nr:sulfotransferase 1E1-like isoform X1 [Styela clava]